MEKMNFMALAIIPWILTWIFFLQMKVMIVISMDSENWQAYYINVKHK